VFEQDQSESVEPRPEKKVSAVVLLAAGGVLVATVCATFASMLAGGEAKTEAGPPKAKAEVEVDQPATTSTSLSIAPDGSTATVVVTVPGRSKGGPDRPRNAAGPVEGEVAPPEVVVTQTEVVSSEETTRPPTRSNPPSTSSSASSVPSVTTDPPATSTPVPPVSGDPSKP
jgi:hypothetical protein